MITTAGKKNVVNAGEASGGKIAFAVEGTIANAITNNLMANAVKDLASD